MRMGRQESSFLSISFTLRCPKSNALAAPRVGIIVIIVSHQRQQGAAPRYVKILHLQDFLYYILYYSLFVCSLCLC